MEKTVLRYAFAVTGILPYTVLWRRKEAFSDGISAQGTSWFHLAKEQGEKERDPGYTVNPPKTPEALWYRNLFVAYFSDLATIPAMWMPRFVKATDPSARTLVDYNGS